MDVQGVDVGADVLKDVAPLTAFVPEHAIGFFAIVPIVAATIATIAAADHELSSVITDDPLTFFDSVVCAVIRSAILVL